MPNLLITSMGGAGSRNLVESLRFRIPDHEYRIVGTHFDPVELAKSDLEHLFLVPKASDRERYVEAHLRLIDRFDIDVLIPNSDNEALVFAEAGERIPCRHLLPDARQIEAVQDKLHFHEILHRHGCGTVPNIPIESLDDIEPAVRALPQAERYWIRMRQGSGSVGATWFANASQARRWVELWCELREFTPANFVLSSFLPGRDFCVSLVMQDGEFCLGKIYERLAYWNMDVSMSGMGSAPRSSQTVAETEPIDEARNAVRAVCTEFGVAPNGHYQADLKCDDNGRPIVTEINIGRFPMTSPQFDRVGQHSPLVQYLSLALHPEVQLPRIGYDLDPGIVILRGPDMPVMFVKQARIDDLERNRLNG